MGQEAELEGVLQDHQSLQLGDSDGVRVPVLQDGPGRRERSSVPSAAGRVRASASRGPVLSRRGWAGQARHGRPNLRGAPFRTAACAGREDYTGRPEEGGPILPRVVRHGRHPRRRCASRSHHAVLSVLSPPRSDAFRVWRAVRAIHDRSERQTAVVPGGVSRGYHAVDAVAGRSRYQRLGRWFRQPRQDLHREDSQIREHRTRPRTVQE